MTEHWRRVEMPYICERMIAFSIPDAGRIAIVSYEGVHVIDLESAEAIESDRSVPEGSGVYDEERMTLTYGGSVHRMLGLHGGAPIVRTGAGDELEVDVAGERLIVRDAHGNVALDYRYEDLSGDWVAATFSRDGRFVLLGVPYELYVFRRT